jgi:hypothetical protein
MPTESFPRAFAKLLRSRGIVLPRGLLSAPPEAYGHASAEVVDGLARLPDDELRRYAERVAGFAARQAARAKAAWSSSPLIAEIRRRKLTLPPAPARVVGASVSLAKPLAEWTDRELLAAAREWSKRGREDGAKRLLPKDGAKRLPPKDGAKRLPPKDGAKRLPPTRGAKRRA